MLQVKVEAAANMENATCIRLLFYAVINLDACKVRIWSWAVPSPTCMGFCSCVTLYGAVLIASTMSTRNLAKRTTTSDWKIR